MPGFQTPAYYDVLKALGQGAAEAGPSSAPVDFNMLRALVNQNPMQFSPANVPLMSRLQSMLGNINPNVTQPLMPNVTGKAILGGLGKGAAVLGKGVGSTANIIGNANIVSSLLGRLIGAAQGVDTGYSSLTGPNPFNLVGLGRTALSGSGGVENFGSGGVAQRLANMGGGGIIGDLFRSLQQESQTGTAAYQSQRNLEAMHSRVAAGKPASTTPQPDNTNNSGSVAGGGGGVATIDKNRDIVNPNNRIDDWEKQMAPMLKVEAKLQSMNLPAHLEQSYRNRIAMELAANGTNSTLAGLWAQNGPALPNAIAQYRAGFIGPDSTFGKLLQIQEQSRGQAGVAEIQRAGVIQQSMTQLLAEHPDVSRALTGQWSGWGSSLMHGGQNPIVPALQNLGGLINVGPQAQTQVSPAMQQLIPNIQQMPGMGGYLQNMMSQQPPPVVMPNTQSGMTTPNIDPAAMAAMR